MPNLALKTAIREAFAVSRASVTYFNTLELTHPNIAEPLRIVQGFREIEATIETEETVTFQPIPFNFLLPASGEDGLQEMQIQFCNVDNQVGDFCLAALGSADPVVILFRPYLSTDLTESQLDPPLRLFLLNVKITNTTVVGRAASQDWLNQPFPKGNYTVERFKGLQSI
mgnify:CR=1 FL=1